MSRIGRQIDFSREKSSSAQSEEMSSYTFHTSLITNLVLDRYNVSLMIFPILYPQRISPIIQFPLDDIDLTLVDHLSLYLSTCPIKHLFWPSVSYNSQDNTVQGSSPHKCGQKVCCRTFNTVVAVFSLDILRHLPILCSHSAYLYHQSVLETFSWTVDHLYRPWPWLTKDAFILNITSYAVMIKTNFSIC